MRRFAITIAAVAMAVSCERAAEKVGGAVRGKQVVFDESLSVDSGGAQMRGFTIPSPRPVQVSVTGLKDTDKGYSVYVMNQSEWENFKAKKEFRHIPSFEGLKVKTMTHTETLPTGSYALVVANTENIFNSMVVGVKVVTDPDN